jgi:arylsulfatase A-like enzyme
MSESLVLVVADSLRPDALSCLGGPARTPFLDRLAGEGLFVPRAVSSAPWTVPSLAALLTGVHAHRLGLVRWEQPWPAGHPTVFALAARAGIEVASFVFDPTLLFAGLPEAGVAGSSQDLPALVEWLRARRGRPFLLFVHYWWTHVPYLDRPLERAPWNRATSLVLSALRAGPEARAGVVRLYHRAVERFSEEFLPRLAAAADLDRTWLVLTADHGESWGERPGTGPVRDVLDLHGRALFEEVLRVPLLFRPPGGGPRRSAAIAGEGLARSIDLLPTLVELLGLGPVPPEVDGLSLASCLRDGSPAPATCAVSAESADPAALYAGARLPPDPVAWWPSLALTTARRKLLLDSRTGRRRAFDLERDPGEAAALDDPDREELAGGFALLERELGRARSGTLPPDEEDAVAARLLELGYLEGERPAREP